MQVITKHLKEAVEFIAAILYAPLLILKKKSYSVVLYYHGIKKIDVKAFREQISYLAQNCSVVKPSEIKTAAANNTNNAIAITFDDAFVNIYENAVPILKQYNLPAGIFVPVGNIAKNPEWKMPNDCPDRNEAIMSARQIEELDKEGFEIFSHTLSHPVLTSLDDENLETELASSKDALAKIVGHEISGISYPHGAFDSKVCKAAKKCGYKLGFTIEPSLVNGTTDPLKIGRFSTSPNDRLTKFRLKVSGAYQSLLYLQKLERLLKEKFSTNNSKNNK